MLLDIQQNKRRSIYGSRPTLVSGGFKRVSMKRPCRICGKATYCGFSSDEDTSICLRVSAGARGPSRNGGNIHVHREIPIITFPPTITIPSRESIPLAPLQIKDAVFQELIRMSPVSKYGEELVIGSGGLLSRGLLDEQATKYAALPPTKRERSSLATILSSYIRNHFPDYATTN